MSDKPQYTEDDLGPTGPLNVLGGTAYGERIVMVHCDICLATFIGPIARAGGWVAGHAMYHEHEERLGRAADVGFIP